MGKKKIRAIGGGGGISYLPHDLAVEVLKRTPAKSLLRFKCVSKLWRSTIADRRFLNDHRVLSRSRAEVLLMYPDRDSDGHINHLHLFKAALLGRKSESVLYHHFTVSPLEYTGFTEVINGLFCLYADDRLSLCNISTHETMELPPIPRPCYFFGFEPTTKEYKVLQLFNSYCVILTVGKDASWRRICVKPRRLSSQSVCVDGALYWISQPNGWSNYNRYLVAFDLKDERFEMIPLPLEALEHRDLVQFRGNLALVGFGGQRYGWEGDFDIWVFEKGYERGGSWTKHVIRIPIELTIAGCCAPAANISTGWQPCMRRGNCCSFTYGKEEKSPILHSKKNAKEAQQKNQSTRTETIRGCLVCGFGGVLEYGFGTKPP